jgi:hypothetical protein
MLKHEWEEPSVKTSDSPIVLGILKFSEISVHVLSQGIKPIFP